MPVLRINNRREGLSVISTVTNKGEMRWKVFFGALNAKILIGFLTRLIRQCDHKIFLILDNLRVHHSKLAKRWLADNAEKIEVFYLPSYSPELNPNELLNADLKHPRHHSRTRKISKSTHPNRRRKPEKDPEATSKNPEIPPAQRRQLCRVTILHDRINRVLCGLFHSFAMATSLAATLFLATLATSVGQSTPGPASRPTPADLRAVAPVLDCRQLPAVPTATVSNKNRHHSIDTRSRFRECGGSAIAHHFGDRDRRWKADALL